METSLEDSSEFFRLLNSRIDEFNQDDDNNGRCPNCGEDELQFGADCYYCGWPDRHDGNRIDVV